MALHSWNVIREGANAQVYLLAKVENPDQDFQLDSGYKVHGTALFQMPVEVEWENRGLVWCPNLETYGWSQNSEFSAQTNLIHGREATVEYPLDFLGDVQQITLEDVEYNEEKYFFPFQGKVALYCWETENFEEIQNLKKQSKSAIFWMIRLIPEIVPVCFPACRQWERWSENAEDYRFI